MRLIRWSMRCHVVRRFSIQGLADPLVSMGMPSILIEVEAVQRFISKVKLKTSFVRGTAVHDEVLGLLRGWGHARVREESVNGVQGVLNRPLLVSDGARGTPEGDIISVYRKTEISKSIQPVGKSHHHQVEQHGREYRALGYIHFVVMSPVRCHAPGHGDRECALRQESLYEVKGADAKLCSTCCLDDGFVSDRIQGLSQVDGHEGVEVLSRLRKRVSLSMRRLSRVVRCGRKPVWVG